MSPPSAMTKFKWPISSNIRKITSVLRVGIDYSTYITVFFFLGIEGIWSVKLYGMCCNDNGE